MKWTKEEIELLRIKYPVFGTNGLLELNRSIASIHNKAKLLGIHILENTKSNIAKVNATTNRKYKEYKVSDLTTNINEYSAYILGLLWTDGYLQPKRNTTALTMLKDDLLEIDWIFKKTGNWYIQDRRRKGRRESRTISAYNPVFCNSLISLDYDRKSYISPCKIVKNIPEQYMRYFFRGVIDGDGCFYLNKKRYTYQLTIASTYEQDWSCYLKYFSKMGFIFSIQKRATIKSKSSIIRICKRDDIINLSRWLYDGYLEDGIGLTRKYNKSLLFYK